MLLLEAMGTNSNVIIKKPPFNSVGGEGDLLVNPEEKVSLKWLSTAKKNLST